MRFPRCAAMLILQASSLSPAVVMSTRVGLGTSGSLDVRRGGIAEGTIVTRRQMHKPRRLPSRLQLAAGARVQVLSPAHDTKQLLTTSLIEAVQAGSKKARKVKVQIVLTNAIVGVRVKEPATAGDVKDALEEKFGLSENRQVIVFKGRALNDDELLAKAGVGSADELRLVVRSGTSVAVKFRDSDGTWFHLTMTLAKNASRTQQDVRTAIETALRLPADVQELRIGKSRLNNSSGVLEGLTPLNVLRVGLVSRPHLLVDALLTSTPLITASRFRRYPFARSTTLGTLQSDIADWLKGFKDLNMTSIAFRFFFRGVFLEDKAKNFTFADVGMRPCEGVVPIDIDDYSSDSRLLVLRRNVSEEMISITVRIPMSSDVLELNGLVPSDQVWVLAELLTTSLFEDGRGENVQGHLTYRGTPLMLDDKLSDYDIVGGSSLYFAMELEAGGWEAHPSRSRLMPD